MWSTKKQSSTKRQRPLVVDKDGYVRLSGEIARIHLIASWVPDERYDSKISESFPEIKGELETFITGEVKENLGPEFDVYIDINQGSIDLLLIVGIAINVIILYKDIIESINLIVSQVRRLLRSILERRGGHYGPHVSISGGLTPDSPIVNVRRMVSREIKSSDIVLYYLVASHAGLLVLFIWIVIKQLSLI